MSFSSSVKNELCRVDDTGCVNDLRSEFSAIIRIGAIVRVTDQGGIELGITTENAAFARRIFSFVKGLYRINAKMNIKRSHKLKNASCIC